MNAGPLDRKFSVAPMMDLTDRHFRYLFRLISPHALLYSEMLTAPAVIHGDREYLLGFSGEEHPLALQLGGSDPVQLVEASRIAEQFGYDEINLNCGCPSDRVQSGNFGACLMADPRLVADCLDKMQQAVSVPVTVKCRIGIDRRDSFDELLDFVQVLYEAGCRVFIIHARKAWLDGLSPRENRDIPPLRYDFVYRIKQLFPSCTIVINGGIKTREDVVTHLQHVDGVMLGREAYYNPWGMVDILKEFYDYALEDRKQLVEQYLAYMLRQTGQGVPLSRMTRHLIALYQAVPGARAWRRCLSENVRDTTSVEALVREALSAVEDRAPDRVACR
ncbi:MAG: tRNA dihydrouridine(20/20a) synthase DusA [Gammaproteobacteria bacterium]|nr:tRNA dihydrouridine(20/20a) synthase DusA [Gammaproteobacteria bacterium]